MKNTYTFLILFSILLAAQCFEGAQDTKACYEYEIEKHYLPDPISVTGVAYATLPPEVILIIIYIY